MGFRWTSDRCIHEGGLKRLLPGGNLSVEILLKNCQFSQNHSKTLFSVDFSKDKMIDAVLVPCNIRTLQNANIHGFAPQFLTISFCSCSQNIGKSPLYPCFVLEILKYFYPMIFAQLCLQREYRFVTIFYYGLKASDLRHPFPLSGMEDIPLQSI